MFLKNFFLSLVLLIWTAELVTCQLYAPIECTPEMKKVCEEFCSVDPELDKYCAVGRLTNQCTINTKRKENNTRIPSACVDRKKDICFPLRNMLRCQDSAVRCDCNRFRSKRKGCTAVLKPQLIDCPQNSLNLTPKQ